MIVSNEQKMDELGRMGEKIVVNYLSKQGHTVEESIDKYDSNKDLLCDGQTVEVKTQVPFIRQRAFTFKENQLRKCRNVDVLYFVCVPAPSHSFEWAGWLFKADPKAFKTRKYRTSDGRDMILVDIEQDALIPIEKISDQNIEQLKKYTVSKY